MTQTLGLMISGVSWTARSKDYDYSAAINRAYDVLTFTTLGEFPETLSTVEFVAGDLTFRGFVRGVSREGRNGYTVTCYSDTARLTLPFSQPVTKAEPYKTATELCAAYAAEAGIEIEYRSVDLDFGASFERNGTMLDALTQVARVTGSTIRVADGGHKLIIEPLEEVGAPNKSVTVGEYFDFVSWSTSEETRGVGKVIVSDGETIGAADQKITVDVDRCSGLVTIYPVPYETVSVTAGMVDFSQDQIAVTETFQLVDEEVIDLKAEAASIISVKLNGAEITPTEVEGSVVYLGAETTGFVEVRYFARVYVGSAVRQATPAGVYYLIRLDHNGKEHVEQGYLDAKCTNDGRMCQALPRGITFCVPDKRYYVKGFYTYSVGGMPYLTYRVDGDERPGLFHPDCSVVDYRVVDEVRPETFVTATGGQTRARLRFEPKAIVEVYTSDTDTPGYHIDGPYIVLDQKYHNVRVSYDVETIRCFFRHDQIQGEVELVANGVSYDLLGFDKYDLDSYPCELGHEMPVNVTGTLGMDLTWAVGRNVTINSPHGDPVGNYSIDNFGYVFFAPDQGDGRYRITYSDDPKQFFYFVANTSGDMP